MQLVHRFNKAVEIATLYHQLQLRKGSKVPYITHPYTVALLLLQVGCSEDVVIAGLLHDTVEDTSLTAADIIQEFGSNVGKLVEECSEQDKSKSWEERKLHTIEKIESVSIEACMIICVDKLHNIRSTSAEIKEVGEMVWNRFNRGKEKQKWYYQNMVVSLEKRIPDFPYFPLFKQEVKEVFSK